LAWLYLAAKPSHMGADVERLDCFLHHPTVCSRQTEGQSFLTSVAASYHALMGGGTILGVGVKPPGLDIWCGVV
jgi:hypothetical protein